MDKELFIMRHAKSAWNSNDGDSTDKARPLKKRGANAAKRIGDGLLRLGWVPEKILLSPAKRVRQTFEMISLDVPFEEDSRIYAANGDDLFAVLADISETIKKVMIIGHNPSLEALLLHLAPTAEYLKNGKLLTTANVARIGINGKWADLRSQKGQLLGLIRPKEMQGE